METLKLWVRPTINWKIDTNCNKIPRDRVTQALEELHKNMDLNYNWLRREEGTGLAILWFVMLALSVISFSFSFEFSRQFDGEFKCAFLVIFVI